MRKGARTKPKMSPITKKRKKMESDRKRDLRSQKSKRSGIINWDDRERLPVSQTILKDMGYTVMVKRMPVGDYSWDLKENSYLYKGGYRSVMIERKTRSDFRDVKRLVRQLVKMQELRLKENIFTMLLLEDKFDTDRERRWTDRQVHNALLSIQASGMFTTMCVSGKEIGIRLDELYQWSQKTSHDLWNI